MFSKPESYSKQLAIYLDKGEFDEAVELGKEFTSTFPKLVVSHYFLALAATRKKDYDTAEPAARQAFNLASGQDLVMTGLLLGEILYLKDKPKEAYAFLLQLQEKESADIEELLILCAAAQNDKKKAVKHFQRLMQLSDERAAAFAKKYLS